MTVYHVKPPKHVRNRSLALDWGALKNRTWRPATRVFGMSCLRNLWNRNWWDQPDRFLMAIQRTFHPGNCRMETLPICIWCSLRIAKSWTWMPHASQPFTKSVENGCQRAWSSTRSRCMPFARPVQSWGIPSDNLVTLQNMPGFVIFFWVIIPNNGEIGRFTGWQGIDLRPKKIFYALLSTLTIRQKLLFRGFLVVGRLRKHCMKIPGVSWHTSFFYFVLGNF